MKPFCAVLFLAALNTASVGMSFFQKNWWVFIWASFAEILLLLMALAFYRYNL